ncbi:uncharacterized protein LOC131673330 [Phymastichus coffea]|uniref:uncharacterized protein LOC131673330 n=1 Tax=Phymastichus coffea TaxID=108790 RepID=UPI00273C0323|nr:uncharacterized protein LOC131673330 [Phymastichus coffea]
MTELSIFRSLFAYKNFLTRRRHWILTVVLQIVIPLLLLLGVWHFGDLVPDIRSKSEIDHRAMSRQCKVNLFIVPNNRFTEELADRMDYCLQMNINNLRIDAPDSDGRPCHRVNLEKNRFDTEKDILRVYESFYPSQRNKWLGYAFTAAVIFRNDTANYYIRNFKYTLKIPTSLSKELYAKQSTSPVELTYEKGFATFQKCVDEEIINMKNNNRDSKLQIDFQEMPGLHYVKPDIADEKRRQMFCVALMLSFLITLCVEVYLVSNEKFSGINVGIFPN